MRDRLARISKGNFSEFPTGRETLHLSRPGAHQACGQDIGQLGYAFPIGHLARVERVGHGVSIRSCMARPRAGPHCIPTATMQEMSDGFRAMGSLLT